MINKIILETLCLGHLFVGINSNNVRLWAVVIRIVKFELVTAVLVL